MNGVDKILEMSADQADKCAGICDQHRANLEQCGKRCSIDCGNFARKAREVLKLQ